MRAPNSGWRPRSAAWTSFRKSVFSGSERSLALCYPEALLCNSLQPAARPQSWTRWRNVCHGLPRKRGTEIEDINLDQVKIGDTILIFLSSSRNLPGGRRRHRASWVMDEYYSTGES